MSSFYQNKLKLQELFSLGLNKNWPPKQMWQHLHLRILSVVFVLH